VGSAASIGIENVRSQVPAQYSPHRRTCGTEVLAVMDELDEKFASRRHLKEHAEKHGNTKVKESGG
jgi:hypothetical protein